MVGRAPQVSEHTRPLSSRSGVNKARTEANPAKAIAGSAANVTILRPPARIVVIPLMASRGSRRAVAGALQLRCSSA